MKKVLILFMFTSLFFIVLPMSEEVSAHLEEEKYYEVFDYLYERDEALLRGDIVVDSISDGNEVIYGLVNYSRSGTYTVKVKLTDLVGNYRYKFISVKMIDGGVLMW